MCIVCHGYGLSDTCEGCGKISCKKCNGFCSEYGYDHKSGSYGYISCTSCGGKGYTVDPNHLTVYQRFETFVPPYNMGVTGRSGAFWHFGQAQPLATFADLWPRT